MNLFVRIACYSSCLLLVGCGYFASKPSIIQGRGKAYLSAHSIPPIRILPGMQTASIHNEYPIPDRHYPDSEKSVNILPPGLNTAN